jgi:O-antigen/teichoic acid export membrane protein
LTRAPQVDPIHVPSATPARRAARARAADRFWSVQRKAPELQPLQIVRDLAMVGGGTLVSHALGVITALLLRALLEPSVMGIWSVLKLVLSYGNYAGLGVSKGAAREIAIHHGKGDAAAVWRIADLAFSVNSATSLLYMLGLAALAGWSALTAGPLARYWSVGLLTVGMLAVLQRFATFSVQVLRAQRRFQVTARLTVLEALVTLIATGVGLWFFGLYGLLGATALTTVTAIAYLAWQRAATFHLCWDWTQIRRLLAVGAPILINGAVFSLFQCLDRLMILSYLPDREFQLGCYSLATMVGNQLFGLANIVGIVMYPRYHEHFGRTGDVRAVARLARRVLGMMLLGSGALALVTALAAPPLLSWLLPAYSSGLPAMLVLLLGTVCLACTLPMTHYCIAVGRQKRVVATTIVALGLAAALNHAVLTAGGGITAVAAATAAAYGAYAVLLLIAAPDLVAPGRFCPGRSDDPTFEA